MAAGLEVGGVPAGLLVDTGASHSILKWSEALQKTIGHPADDSQSGLGNG